PTNDELTDDVIDQTPETGDEDDHDIAEVVTSSRVIDRIAEPSPAPAPGGPSPAGPPPARSSSPSNGVLPRTGTDLVGLVGLGLALVAVGTVAVRRRRPGVEVGA
ncbi:MAG: LPXTG cell wall anchor domain-containing protein, partial [Acidimicrobiales bacterium]|nr:LPXTG cell wall anchor domain-containing protein [Acidimicrobiales bacterium]